MLLAGQLCTGDFYKPLGSTEVMKPDCRKLTASVKPNFEFLSRMFAGIRTSNSNCGAHLMAFVSSMFVSTTRLP